MNKIYNFSAGPAVLNQSVLKAMSEASIDYLGSGISLMEMSHRSELVMEMVSQTKILVRDLLSISNEYEVLFLQGGASLQFSMIPMNLLNENQVADYADTGAWSNKAIKEAENFGEVNVICSSKDSTYNHIPKELKQNLDSTYLHLTSNNTIYQI